MGSLSEGKIQNKDSEPAGFRLPARAQALLIKAWRRLRTLPRQRDAMPREARQMYFDFAIRTLTETADALEIALSLVRDELDRAIADEFWCAKEADGEEALQ